MDIELTPEELPAPKIKQIAQRAAEAKGIDSADALALIRHLLWQDDQIELTRVRLDPFLDKANGNPALISLH